MPCHSLIHFPFRFMTTDRTDRLTAGLATIGIKNHWQSSLLCQSPLSSNLPFFSLVIYFYSLSRSLFCQMCAPTASIHKSSIRMVELSVCHYDFCDVEESFGVVSLSKVVVSHSPPSLSSFIIFNSKYIIFWIVNVTSSSGLIHKASPPLSICWSIIRFIHWIQVYILDSTEKCFWKNFVFREVPSKFECTSWSK